MESSGCQIDPAVHISHININGEPKTISRLTPPKRHVGSEREWSHCEELDFLVKIGGVCLPECQRDARTEAKSVARKNTGQLEILMLFRIKTKHLQNLILFIFLEAVNMKQPHSEVIHFSDLGCPFTIFSDG